MSNGDVTRETHVLEGTTTFNIFNVATFSSKVKTQVNMNKPTWHLGAAWALGRLSSSRSLGHRSNIRTRSATEPRVRNGRTGFGEAAACCTCLKCCRWVFVNSGWGAGWCSGLRPTLVRGPQRVTTSGFVFITSLFEARSSDRITPFFRAFIRRFSSRAT